MSRTVHRIVTTELAESDRSYWECSCGNAGTSPTHKVDLASDRHVGPGEMRIDTNKLP